MEIASSHAKLRHAGDHLDRVVTTIEETLSAPTNRATLGSRFDEATGMHSVFVSAVPDLGDFSEAVGLGVGDVLSNLRGALDHAAWKLAIRHVNARPAKPRNIYFPICKADGTCLSPDFLSAGDWTVLHEWQPCKGSNGRPDNYSGAYVHQLEQLVELNNIDKHRTLTEIGLAPHQMMIRPVISFGLGDWERPDFIRGWGLGTEVAKVRGRDWPREEQSDIGSARPAVLLPGYGTAVPTLKRMHRYVTDVLESIDAL